MMDEHEDDSKLDNWTKLINVFLSFPANKWSKVMKSVDKKQTIWKARHFVKKSLDIFYRNHIGSHSAHIARQPSYYKGMFDIMN